MYAQLFAFLLFACQVILNESSVVSEDVNTVEVENSSTTRPATRPTGYVTFSDVNAAYRVYEEETTWYEARDRCIAEGAHLAIPDSVEKIVHINSLKTPSDKWLHVGIVHSTTTNQWVRVDDGLPAKSIPWIEDNPDGTGDCAGVSISEDGLVDYSCDWGGEYFVCEKSI